MGKLFEAVRFETEHVADAATREAIEEHNLKVELRWLSDGGDAGRKSASHVTDATLDHLRPSPEWKQEEAELELVKEAEAVIRKGLRRLGERDKRHADQLQHLQQVADSMEGDPF